VASRSPRGKPAALDRGFDVDWRESIGYLLRDTSRLMLRVTAARVGAYGLTLTQYFLLRQLWEADGQTQRQLARQLAVPESALAALLGGLEEAGFVARERDAEDRRRVEVRVTRAGKALRAPLLDEGEAVLATMVAGVSQTAIKAFRRTLKRMKANLDAAAGPPN
jgi:DNA-binding MarR family transcriptional regulator